MIRICRLCGAPAVETLLDLGKQPVTSFYLRSRGEAFAEYPMALAYCHRCGLAQLREAFPYKELVPRYPWTGFREPERHLDAVVEKIAGLDGIGPDSIFAGISAKDDTTLVRLERRGFRRGWVLDPRDDLGADDRRSNVETIQALLVPEKAAQIVGKRGLADVVIARHILEHASDPRSFLDALPRLVREGGYIVIEVPDCARNFRLQDYTMLWEEHVLYFTARTLNHVMAVANCSSVDLEAYPYVFEDCLVQIGRKRGAGDGGMATHAAAPTADEQEMVRRYARQFCSWTDATRSFLKERRDEGGIALYGAGHLGAAFINFHGIGDLMDLVVDDQAEKQGLFMPKSGLPICGRAALEARRIPLCLFAFAPESEPAVATSNQWYLDDGGRFYSIFAASERSFRRAMRPGVAL